MSKRTFIAALILSLSFTMLVQTYWNESIVYSLTENFTVPTRTPVPQPTKKSSGGGSGGGSGSSQPTATHTPIPATPTNTAVPVTIAATPEGGFVPTAEACSDQPTIQAVNTTRVRLGPGTDYEIVGELVYLEVRPVIGRAAETKWWQIVMADNTIGWVSDDIVVVEGNISVLPVVAAPVLDGVEPTSAPLWEPTVSPGCEVLAAWTSTPEPTIPPTAEPTDTPVPPTETSEPEVEVDEVVEEVETAEEVLPTETAVSPTSPPQPTAPPTPVPTAEPLDVQTQSSNAGFLPIVAVGLLAVAGVFAFLRRNRG